MNRYLAKDSSHSVACGIIVVAIMGVYANQGVQMVVECIRSVMKAGGGGKLVKSCETFSSGGYGRHRQHMTHERQR